MQDLFDELRRITELMETSFWSPRFKLSRFRMPVFNIRETETKLIAEVELPGMSKEDIELNVTKDSIEVKAEKKREREEKKKGSYAYAAASRSFYRRMSLPVEVKAEEAKATYKEGMLTIEIPKEKKATIKGKKIEIR